MNDSGIVSVASYISFFVFFCLLFVCILYLYFFITGLIKKRSPLLTTYKEARDLLCTPTIFPPGSHILDLGCGDGRTLCTFVNFCGGSGYGVDVNLYAVLLAKTKVLFGKYVGYPYQLTHSSDVKICYQDAQHINIQGFSHIYIFLYPHEMHSLEQKIFLEKEKSCIIITFMFQFKEHRYFETITDGKNTMYLYK